MFVWCSPLQLLGVQGRGEGQHLQCHRPAERDLLRLVDDPHAAATNLAEDAEVPQGACHGHFRRRSRQVPGPGHGAVQQPQGSQDLPQHQGRLRVAGHVLLDVRPLAPLLPPQELVRHLAYQRLQ
jgi:hypothetical protein